MHYTKKENGMGILLLLPALIALAALIIYPFCFAIKLSFHSQLIYEIKGHFVGFANYLETFRDPDFWNATKLSMIWVFTTVVGQMVIGIIVALFLNEDFRGRGLARAFILLPFFMPMISITLMWRWLLNESYGIINSMLISAGLIDHTISWLGTPAKAFLINIIIGIWSYYPFVVINVLAGLQTIPKELYESAKMDGANFWTSFWYITMPSIKNVVGVVAMLRIIFMFKKFDQIYMLTGGGPGVATTTMPLYAYKYAFTGMQLGRGSAITLIIATIVSIVVFLYMKLSKMNETVEV
ncbi:carbohydrate ABC transporter permease [Sediminispirochaeta bajacaliforniensis]|uniref:carbohydrate ABC transporter permease n=1 Tax=Sediminispirochaeta bajacaliforniensis TaxID=148 RepID=UPI0003676B00|nr:sugar ABC transporter permease [Sediminispirochaeta bajacaliforniensis]